ncbi:MAG: cytochrome c oxidase subunit II [Candidatus Rokuibacteriota bacterium]|nr:MAG: cytochrome c oxidase subunit II [Candidatus Rokubacteria bacterium]
MDDATMTTRGSALVRLRTVVLLVGVLVLASSCGWSLWDSPMTTVRPRSDFGRWIDDIFMLISWTTLVIFIAVEGLLVYCCWRFRERPGAPLPKQTHGHTPLEISWTVAFAVVLLIIGIPTIRIIFKTQEAPAATALHVDVSGKQWWWEFKYPDLKIATANEVHLPVGQTVAFFLHAPDVIHSFWIPGLGGKRDVVPQRVNRLIMTPEVPGEYLGQCAEYCGMSHANMRFRAIVHPKAEFEQWVKAQQAAPVESQDALAQEGKDVFGKSACVGCHTIAGTSAGQIGPDLTHFASRKTFAGSLMGSTPENLIKWIENPDHMKPGARMPNLGMTADQSKALAAYLLSLR